MVICVINELIEKITDDLPAPAGFHGIMQPIDNTKYTLMLTIDFLDMDRIFFIPLNEWHLQPPCTL
jgi:hypothetical protein